MHTGRNENSVLRFMLAEFKPGVLKFVLENHGSEEEAEDILQDGIIALREQVLSKKFRGESSVKTYHFRICRFMWLNCLKRKKVEAGYRDYLEEKKEFEDNTPEHLFLEEEKKNVLLELLGRMGEKCRQVLQLTFYARKSMKEIALEMGYKNVQPAKNKVYLCKKALKDLVKNDPALKKILLEFK